MFDLAKAFAKKQEVESARLDEYWFRHRARTLRLLAEGLAGQMDEPIDSRGLAREVAVRTDERILADLRARLVQPMDDREWHRLLTLAQAEARRQLVAEYGDPEPHRLA
jgi:hypothetical protein